MERKLRVFNQTRVKKASKIETIKKLSERKKERIKKKKVLIKKAKKAERIERKKIPKTVGRSLNSLSLPRIVNLQWLKAGRNLEKGVFNITERDGKDYYGYRAGYKDIWDAGRVVEIPSGAKWQSLNRTQIPYYW